MKETLRKLLYAFGPSGREDAVRAVVEQEIRPYVDEMRTDALGNLIAVKQGKGRRIMLAAHMDQIGFVVTEADEHGFLRVHNVGYPRRLHSLNRHLVFENGVRGVLSYEAEDHDPKDASMKAMFVDIGAASREEALARVEIGDMATYVPELCELTENLLSAPAMDDRAGCALLIEVLRQLRECPNEVAFVFTTQEEVGLRGAGPAAYDVRPDEAVAIDVTPAGDPPKADRLPVKLNAGIAVKIMDNSLVCAPSVVAALERAGDEAGARYQREVLTYGGTDAGRIHLSRGGVRSGVLSIPCRYVHSATEVVSLKDMEAGVKLLTKYLMKV